MQELFFQVLGLAIGIGLFCGIVNFVYHKSIEVLYVLDPTVVLYGIKGLLDKIYLRIKTRILDWWNTREFRTWKKKVLPTLIKKTREPFYGHESKQALAERLFMLNHEGRNNYLESRGFGEN